MGAAGIACGHVGARFLEIMRRRLASSPNCNAKAPVRTPEEVP